MLKEHKSKPGEDLTEAAVQRCSLQYIYFLKKVESWKQPAYIFIFSHKNHKFYVCTLQLRLYYV